MRKTLVLPVAGLIALGGAGAVLAQTGAPTTDASTPAVLAAASASPSTGTITQAEPKDTLLSDVLKNLVSKGTITQAQSDAITKGLSDRRTELQTERQKERQQLQSFLADGEITKAELDQLPADSPLRQLTNLMADGKITTDELRSIGRGFGFGHGGPDGFGPGMGRGHRGMGDGMWGGPNAPDASPNASPAASADASGSSS